MQVDLWKVLEAFLENFNVNLTLISSKEDDITKFDLGIRKIFGNQNTYEKIAAYVCDTCESRKLYVLQDVFETEYCMFCLPEEERSVGNYCLIGPYQNEKVEENWLNELVQTHKIPTIYMGELQEYYQAMPILPTIKSLKNVWYPSYVCYTKMKGNWKSVIWITLHGQKSLLRRKIRKSQTCRRT